MAIFPELSRMELRGYRDCDVRSGVLEPIPRRPRVLSALKGSHRQYRCCAHDLWVPGGATWTDQLIAPLPSWPKRCLHRGLRKILQVNQEHTDLLRSDNYWNANTLNPQVSLPHPAHILPHHSLTFVAAECVSELRHVGDYVIYSEAIQGM